MARARQVRRPSQGPTYRTNYIKPRKQLHLRNIVRPLGYIVAAVFVLFLIFGSGLFSIRTITVTGAKTIPAGDIQNQVEKLLSESLTGRNTLFISTDKLTQQLKARNTQLGDVQIGRDFLNGLTVKVSEQIPSIGWRSGSSVFVLSSDGRAFSQTDQPGKIPVVNDSANIPVKIGQKIVPSEFIIFVQKIVSELPSQKLEIVTMSVPPESIGELYVQVKGKYIIKFDTGRDAGEQLGDLKSVLASLTAQKKAPAEYIDLRIAGRVFYK